MAVAVKSVAQLCAEHAIDVRQLSERCGVDERWVAAMLHDRWTPSPVERDAIAAVFGLTRDRIAWGHKSIVDHISG